MNVHQKLLLHSPREEFLETLASSGKLDYKRYLGSPLRYAGGKSLAVGYVVERIPSQVNKIVSPFFGGGSVEIACANELGMNVVGYDVFDILCAYWQAQIEAPEKLYASLKRLKPNRDTFKKIKERLKQHWVEGKELSPMDLAVHYYFNSNTSYGPHFLGWPSDVYLNDVRYQKLIAKVRDFSAPTLKVRCAPFEKSIPRHKNDFLYCDPPYYLDEGKMFVGMYPHRNFPVHHVGFDHEKLRDLLLSHKGGFVLSYNDCDVIRDWYAGCKFSTPTWQYTFGQGDTRIGENRESNNGGSHIKKSHELLIWKEPDNG
jgi:DNA adenine methylase